MTSTQRAGIAAREQALLALRTRPRVELAAPLVEGPTPNAIEWAALLGIRHRALSRTITREAGA